MAAALHTMVTHQEDVRVFPRLAHVAKVVGVHQFRVLFALQFEFLLVYYFLSNQLPVMHLLYFLDFLLAQRTHAAH